MYISYGSLVHLTPYQNRNDAFIPLSIYYSLSRSHSYWIRFNELIVRVSNGRNRRV